jgi:hypothetical protein
MNKLSKVVALTLVAASAPAPAIVIRADVPDSKYRELGQTLKDTVARFSCTREDGTFIPGCGSGTLVAPQWVLTAGHNASIAEKNGATIDGVVYPAEAVYLHPDAGKGITRPGTDVALVKLARPVEGGKPACLYPARDEIGQVATIAGFGRTGTHLSGIERGDGILRAATALIEEREVPSWSLYEREGESFETVFRKPSDPHATPLEGSTAPGDSGGPVFLRFEGKLCVAGITENGGGPGAAGRGNSRAGAAAPRVTEFRGGYGRVSSIRAWAMGVMNGKVAP